MSIEKAIRILGDIKRNLPVTEKDLQEALHLAAHALAEKITLRSRW